MDYHRAHRAQGVWQPLAAPGGGRLSLLAIPEVQPEATKASRATMQQSVFAEFPHSSRFVLGALIDDGVSDSDHSKHHGQHPQVRYSARRGEHDADLDV